MVRKTNMGSGHIGISSIVYVAFVQFYLTGSNSTMHNYIQIALFIAWNLMAFLESGRNYLAALNSKPTKYLILFLIYYFFTSIIAGTLVYTLEYVAVFLMLYSCYIPFLYYYSRGYLYEIRFITVTSLVGWAILSVMAISFYRVNPSAARTLAADFTAYENLYIGGGYAIAFGSAVLFVYLFSLLCKGCFGTWKKAFVVGAFLILLFELLVLTESTTTLLACAIGAVAGLFFHQRKSKSGISRIVYYTIILGAIIFVIYGGINTIGSSLVSATVDSTDEVVLRRFNRIGEKLMFAGTRTVTDNYVDERWSLVIQSWNTFTEHPIFGIGHTIGNVYSLLEPNGVGTHSEICDILAQHGVIGFLLLLAFFVSVLRCVDFKLANKSYLVTIFIMALFNPFHYFHPYYVLFSLMPMISVLILNKREKRAIQRTTQNRYQR